MKRRKVLLVGGSLNQTRMVHAVGQHLQETCDCFYSPSFCDGALELARRAGLVEFTVLGERIRSISEAYLRLHNLPVDYGGRQQEYDLFVVTSDLVVPRIFGGKPVVLIQEGMTDPEKIRYKLVRAFNLPRWLAGTATNGLSNRYTYFCVASPGYRDLFIRKGCRAEKLLVTGIPNFDNVASFYENDFPHRDYVLVATSNTRETFKLDDRQQFLRWALEKAAGRPMIFKLHPAENFAQATGEIKALAPDALVYTSGNTDHMIANCSALVTQYSSCIYVGLAMGKECYSYFDMDSLKSMVPIQNGGSSGRSIAQVCSRVLEHPMHAPAVSPPVRRGMLGEGS